MIYKVFVTQKLLRRFFSGKLLQSIVPVKHGYTHFYTLSAIDEFYVL